MLLFATSATHHLAAKMPFTAGDYTIKHLSDQELHVHIHNPIAHQPVILLAHSAPPAENLLELLFLLDALRNAQAKIHLFISYFGYSRQDQPNPGEAFTGRLIAEWLEQFKLHSVTILTMHSDRLQKYMHYENYVPIPLYVSIADKYDMLVAPDQGSIPLVSQVAQATHLKIIQAKKTRPTQSQVKVQEILGDVKGTNLLIVEDMICTGNTVIETSKALLHKGAKSVSVMATHGVFPQGALENLENSSITHLYVTNSLLQKAQTRKLQVLDVTPYIAKKMQAVLSSAH